MNDDDYDINEVLQTMCMRARITRMSQTLVLICLARSAQWSVFCVSLKEKLLGLMFAIMTVLYAPPSESLRS